MEVFHLENFDENSLIVHPSGSYEVTKLPIVEANSSAKKENIKAFLPFCSRFRNFILRILFLILFRQVGCVREP